jgi:hypothetical protein
MTIKIKVDLTDATESECAELDKHSDRLTFSQVRDNSRVLNIEWTEKSSSEARRAQAIEDFEHHPAFR